MGCLLQIFFGFLARFLWYVILNPLLTLFFFLLDIGLIWSIGSYLIIELFFYGTAIHDYQLLITVILLIPFLIKLVRKIKDIHFNIKWWLIQRDMKKFGLSGSANELEEYYAIKREQKQTQEKRETIRRQITEETFRDEKGIQQPPLEEMDDKEKDYSIEYIDGMPVRKHSKNSKLQRTVNEFLEMKRKENDYE